MSFIVKYPVVAPTSIVILPNPELGNSQKISGNRVIHRNRTQVVKAIQITSWPNVISDLYKFKIKDALTLSDFEVFLEAAAGDEIQIIDHDGETREGYITNNTVDIITLKDGCLYDLQIEFERTVT